MSGRALSAGLLLLGFFAGACGAAAATTEQVERAQREVELAARLREEGSVPGAIEHLRASLEADPDNAEAHVLMGVIKLERGDAATADEFLQKGILLLEKQDRFGQRLAEARNVRGVVLVSLRRCDEAAALLRKTAIDEMNTAAHLSWFNLGLAELCRKKPDRAVEALREAVRRQPQFCVGHFRLAEAQVERQDLAAAESAANDAIEAHPLCHARFQAAYQLRGQLRRKLGRLEEAQSDFERCVELGPKNSTGAACKIALQGTQAGHKGTP